MSRLPAGIASRGFRSSPQRVEEKYWSHAAPRRTDGIPGAPFLKKSEPINRSLAEQRVPVLARPSPTPGNRGTTPAQAFQTDHSHAGFPQGFMTRRILSGYLSLRLWLTNAIDRIVKEPKRRPGMRPDSALCFSPIHRYHRPVQASRRAARPAVVRRRLLRSNVNNSPKNSKVNSLARIFRR
jgi:hypothetical protein